MFKKKILHLIKEMSSTKKFSNIGFDTVQISQNNIISNSISELYYYESGINISASSTVVKSIPGLFFTATGGTVLRLGVLKIIATSNTYGTVKSASYPFTTLRTGTTFFNNLGTVFNQMSVEIGNGQTGGDQLTGVVNGDNFDITVDLTDGSGVVSDGVLYVYIEKVF